MIIVRVVTKEEIINKDIEDINVVLQEFRTNAKNSKGRLLIIYDGYNEDTREIFEIDEIRQFVSKLFKENNDLFYFLSDIQGNAVMTMACLGKVEQKKIYDSTHMSIELELEDEVRHDIMNGMISICDDDKEAKKLVKELFGYDSWEV